MNVHDLLIEDALLEAQEQGKKITYQGEPAKVGKKYPQDPLIFTTFSPGAEPTTVKLGGYEHFAIDQEPLLKSEVQAAALLILQQTLNSIDDAEKASIEDEHLHFTVEVLGEPFKVSIPVTALKVKAF